MTTKGGALVTKIAASSQKNWTYFTDKVPATLGIEQMLVVSVSFVPLGMLAETTSRSFRLGVFHDPTNRRVEADVSRVSEKLFRGSQRSLRPGW